MRRMRAQANVDAEPQIVTETRLYLLDLVPGERVAEISFRFISGHAEQQEFIDAGFDILLDLMQHRFRGIAEHRIQARLPASRRSMPSTTNSG